MSRFFHHPATRAGIASLTVLLLAACGQDEPPPAASPQAVEKADPAPAPAQPPARTATPAAAPPPPVAAKPVMKLRKSADAPFACDLLTPAEMGLLLEQKNIEVFDYTQTRRENGTWSDSTCLFAYGKEKDPDKIGMDSQFIRIDVYTDASLQAAEWGPLQDQWEHRARHEADGGGLHLHDQAWAVWVESDHPPDPALLVRQGEVMFEVSYFPPSSSPGTPETRAQIESIARTLLDRLDAVDRRRGANASGR